MDMLNKFSLGVALFALFSFSLPAAADEIQDANKLFKQGQNAQALEKVNAVLAAKPKDAQARFLKGLIVNDQGDTAGAIKIFTELTDDYPELPEPYNNLAVLYAGQGQYEKAKSELEMAIRTHPSYATAHENLGDIYAKMASQAYDRALQLDKSNTATQTKLALIRDLFGKTPRGKAEAPTVVAAAAPTTPAAKPAAAPVAAPAIAAAPATAAATPATPAAPAKTPAAPAADAQTEVTMATHNWAAAWAAKNVSNYLSFYAKNFSTPNGESRSEWEAQRNERISAPKSIQIELRDTKTKMLDEQHISISFVQSYRATNFKSTSRKTLLWVKEGERWLIAEERSGR
ncbi:MAG: tetratricopeptide repeat protein [Sideroxydans sp.]|nr:tetratricopeptide repeat protein [Sideroxydans sp.]